MSAIKVIPNHARNLAPYEVQVFIDWVTYRWTGEDRQRFAQEFPALYNKIVGREVVEVKSNGHGMPALETEL